MSAASVMNTPGLPPFPLPPTFPPGVDPTTYQIDAVNSIIKEAAFLSILSVADPAKPDAPILGPQGIIGVEVNEEPHRFDIAPAEPSRELGIRAANTTGQGIAHVHIRWMPCPDDFEAAPGKEPPPTALDPTRSQRFVMLDGEFRFDDRENSGFHAFGAGRTYPMIANGKPQLGIGSVINIIEGFGKLKGLHITNVVNGYIDPPFGMMLCFMVRIVDPERRLRASSGAEFSPIHAIPDPAPGTSIIAVLGETDPNETVTLNITPDGRMLGSNVVERLRLVHIRYDTDTRRGVRAYMSEGPIVGSLRGTLHFNPLDPRPVFPIYTTNGVLTFFDRHNRTIGTVYANIAEGRAFRTEMPGAPMPVFRFGGFGPFNQGTGQFAGVNGMMSLNAVVSVFPRTLSNLYVLRINDPDGRFRAPLCDAWL
jgi:hypothetical protein